MTPAEEDVIAGETLRLEPQTAAHTEEMFPLLCDPRIYEYENEPPASLAWLRERFTRLESRRSADGREAWLNWVIRLPTGELAGYVQATVDRSRRATIAYILHSRHWGRGIASAAVRLMIDELVGRRGVVALRAVFKRDNARSRRLLERLGFRPVAPGDPATTALEPDEALMVRDAAGPGGE